jgi:hypothetical protein
VEGQATLDDGIALRDTGIIVVRVKHGGSLLPLHSHLARP